MNISEFELELISFEETRKLDWLRQIRIVFPAHGSRTMTIVQAKFRRCAQRDNDRHDNFGRSRVNRSIIHETDTDRY